MPILPEPSYLPQFPFTYGHVQTLYPTLFRKWPHAAPVRERLELEDGDFLDIDWHYSITANSSRLAVISHGLEGNSRKKYMLGMASSLSNNGWDVICLNFRGCSGEMNRLPRLYHSGVTDDLHTVICHGLETGGYTSAALVGFSMGGNQTLKYLGENPAKVPSQVKAAVVFSVPCLLAESGRTMNSLANRIYMEYFMYGLRQKIRIKAEMFPDLYNTKGLAAMKTFFPFDDRYTGPIHGFQNADDYYRQCSSKQFLDDIRVPTLLVQAKDDPFLPQSCYPRSEADKSTFLFLEMPRHGGHVGFVGESRKSNYWMEDRALLYLDHIFN